MKNKKQLTEQKEYKFLGSFYGKNLYLEDIDSCIPGEKWWELLEQYFVNKNKAKKQTAKEELLLKKLEEYQKLTFWDFFWGRDEELKKQINQLW